MKKALAILLAGVMALGVTACGAAPAASAPAAGSEPAAEAEASAPAEDGSYDKIVLVMRTSSALPTDEGRHQVEEELNKILREKIGAEIELQIIAQSSYAQQLTLMLSGAEQVDIALMSGSNLITAIGADQLRDIQPLLDQYAQPIYDLVGEELFACGNFGGVQYGIPSMTEGGQGMGLILMRKDLVEKYGLDLSKVEKLDDLTEIYQTIHDNEPGMNCIGTGPNSAPIVYNNSWDQLGSVFGVLPNYAQDEPLKVVNVFETEDYKYFCDTMHKWYEMGFISPDVTNEADSVNAQMAAGTLFSQFNANKPGIEAQVESGAQHELVGVQTLTTLMKSETAGIWTIPENAKNPEKAVQFLVELYTNPDVLNLLAYGVEGVDYTVREDGRIGYPEGLDAATVPYCMMNMIWAMGYQYNGLVWETNDPDIWEQTLAWRESSLRSKAYGFIFNPAPVSNELAACQNVYDQYKLSIECGVVDPEPAIAQMNEELYAAGLQTVIDEKQAQLDAWLALKGN